MPPDMLRIGAELGGQARELRSAQGPRAWSNALVSWCRQTDCWEGTMKLPRRQFLHIASGAAVLPCAPGIARAQVYPTRPITLIVPFPAGGAADVIARIMAERMRSPLRQ